MRPSDFRTDRPRRSSAWIHYLTVHYTSCPTLTPMVSNFHERPIGQGPLRDCGMHLQELFLPVLASM